MKQVQVWKCAYKQDAKAAGKWNAESKETSKQRTGVKIVGILLLLEENWYYDEVSWMLLLEENWYYWSQFNVSAAVNQH